MIVDTEVTLLKSVAVETIFSGSGDALTVGLVGVDTREDLGVVLGVDLGVDLGVLFGVDLGVVLVERGNVLAADSLGDEDLALILFGSRLPSLGLGEFNLGEPIRGELKPMDRGRVFALFSGPGDASIFLLEAFNVPDLDIDLEDGLGLEFPETYLYTIQSLSAPALLKH